MSSDVGRGRQDEPSPCSSADQLPPADDLAIARNILLRQLEVAARTRAELAAALRRRHVPDDVAELLLTRFAEVGLIDDEAFAQSWVESRSGKLGRSRQALRAELVRKGVGARAAQAAVESLDDESQVAAARAFAERRYRGMSGVDPRVAQRRLYGALARRGFPHQVCAQVASLVVAAEVGRVDD